jgi:hypothetical protein
MTHQEQKELTNSHNSIETNSFFHDKRNKVVLVVAGVALALISAAGVGCKAKASSPESTAATIPNSAPQKSVETTAQIEAKELEKRVAEYESSMVKYREMDIATFETLPREERLLYSQYLIDQTVSRGLYENAYGLGGPGESTAVEFTPVSPDNTGQEILDNSQYARQISNLQFKEEGTKPFDPLDAQKILSSVYYTVGDNNTVANAYISDRNEEMGLNRPRYLTNTLTATSTSKLKNGVNEQGETVQYKIVAYNSSAENKAMYARFVLYEYESYYGETQRTWLLDVNSYTKSDLAVDGSIR